MSKTAIQKPAEQPDENRHQETPASQKATITPGERHLEGIVKKVKPVAKTPISANDDGMGAANQAS